MTMTDTTWDDLEDLEAFRAAPVKASKKTAKFPCVSCGGSGEWSGGVNQHGNRGCFVCKGKGYFKTSQADRVLAKSKRLERKAVKIQEVRDAFDEQHPGLVDGLRAIASWNDFASSLLNGVSRYGGLTENQVPAAKRLLAKVAERDAERQAQRDAEPAFKARVFATLAEAFLSAAADVKWPKLRLRTAAGAPVVLSRCGSQSRTVGHINVTDGKPFGENIYYGRITPEGESSLRRELPADVLEVIETFNADPKAAILVQGQRTGQCCCCGRELTDPASIKAGIGPICADRWGF
jgi:hypothetical protein